MQNTYRQYLLFSFLLCSFTLFGQKTKRILFLGNSYTYVNDLPQMISNAATSTGDTVIKDSNTPGGYYLGEHLTNSISLAKIMSGNWDHVVLQDQSLALAYPSTFMNSMVYSVKLDSIIKANSDCVQTIFYGTWGRKNGGTYLCTTPECDTDTWITRDYYEMDSAIERHYKIFADSVKASMSPVGTVWRYIKRNYPALELHQTDDSHPTVAGTYAAACSFYSAIFRKDPTLITYNPGLSPTDAANIRFAAKEVVFNELTRWNIGVYDTLLSGTCSVLGLSNENNVAANYWAAAPNPVLSHLTLTYTGKNPKESIMIYNTMGTLINVINGTSSTDIDFSGYPNGLYLLRSKNTHQTIRILKQ
jgi:hypothetical protein